MSVNILEPLIPAHADAGVAAIGLVLQVVLIGGLPLQLLQASDGSVVFNRKVGLACAWH